MEKSQTITKSETFSDNNKKQTKPRNEFKAVAFLVAFLLAATTLQFTLKRLIQESLFNFISLINLAQIEFSLFILHSLNLFKLSPALSFETSLSMQKSRRFLPLAFVFVLMIYTGNAPYYDQSITSNSTIKRLTVVPTLIGQWLFLAASPSLMEVLACGVIVSGSLLMGLNDSLDWLGVVLTLANVFCAASYNILIHLLCREEHPVELLYYMNVLALPIYLFAAVVEVVLKGKGFLISLELPAFRTEFLLASVTAIAYNLFAFFSNKYNNPLTLIIAGNAKNVGVVIAELFLFPASRFGKGFFYFFGVGIAALGSFMYGLEKFLQRKNKKS